MSSFEKLYHVILKFTRMRPVEMLTLPCSYGNFFATTTLLKVNLYRI